MRLTNSDKGYGLVHIAIHWATALLIFWAAWRGFTMTELPRFEPATFEAYNFHKSLGITVLALAALRLLWRLTQPVPPLPSDMSELERCLARITHIGLYGLILTVPLLGWLNTSAAGIPVSYFGLAPVPLLIASDQGLKEILGVAHELAAKLLLFLVILHVLGALKHHLIAKDDVLRRMLVPAKD